MLLDRARSLVSTTGTGTITVGGAALPYRSWAQAGAQAGEPYSYLVEDGASWELGHGLYDGNHLVRGGPGSDTSFASSTGALLNLSGNAVVTATMLAVDIDPAKIVTAPAPKMIQRTFARMDNGIDVFVGLAGTVAGNMIVLIVGSTLPIALPSEWTVINSGAQFQNTFMAVQQSQGGSVVLGLESQTSASFTCNAVMYEFDSTATVFLQSDEPLPQTSYEAGFWTAMANRKMPGGVFYGMLIEHDSSNEIVLTVGTPAHQQLFTGASGRHGLLVEVDPTGSQMFKGTIDSATAAIMSFAIGSNALQTVSAGRSQSLATLIDVDNTAPPTNLQVLTYKSSTSKWHPADAVSGATYRGAWTLNYVTRTDTFPAANLTVPAQYAAAAGSQAGIGICVDADALVGTTGCITFLGTDGNPGTNVGNNTQQQFQFNVAASASVNTLTLHYKVNSENGFDGMHVYVDGVQVYQDFTDRTGSSTFIIWNYVLTAGAHTIGIAYTADSRNQNGYENVHLSQISYPAQGVSNPFLYGDVVGYAGAFWSCVTPGTTTAPAANNIASGWVEYSTGGSTLSVTDGTTAVAAVTTLTFAGAAVTTTGAGDATVTIAGGGSASPRVKIAEVIVTTAGPTIVFSAIPQGYRDLRLMGSVRTSLASTRDDCRMTFNGDTGAHYTRNLNSVDNAGQAYTWDATRTNVPTIWAPAGNAGAGFFGTFDTTISDYSQTDRNKAITGLANSIANVGDDYSAVLQGMWFSTAAITQITLAADGNFVVGSRVALYGEI